MPRNLHRCRSSSFFIDWLTSYLIISSKASKAAQKRNESQEPATSTDARQVRASTPLKHEPRSGSTAPPAAVRGTVTYNGKEGKDFPEIRTSKLDLNATPTWPDNGKPITDVDLDADLAENSKLWRLPGTDQTDFFNYGFDEYTWAQYCLRQQTMSNTISDQKSADAQMKAMFGGGNGNSGSAGNSSMPGGIPSMPGMPGPDDMNQIMQQMMSSGMDPNDPGQFFQMMMNNGGMPGMPGGQGQQGQQQGGGNFSQLGGGFGVGNQNRASPHPQSNQGFPPPQGPGGQHSQGDQGGFGGNTDGYSPQQLAIMQQQQQGGQGGGRGRGRGRGRGYH